MWNLALHHAVLTGDSRFVQLILNTEISRNNLDSSGRTPLMYAAHKGDAVIVRQLLEHGCDPDVETPKTWRTAAWYAAAGGDPGTLRLLLKDSVVNQSDRDGRPMLSVAAGVGSVESVQLLLDAGAAPNYLDNEQRTPLHYAAQKGQAAAAQALLDARARPDPVAGSGQTPLGVACQGGHVDVIGLLLASGAAVDREGAPGLSPLGHACRLGLLPAVQRLLDAKAAPDAEDGEGRTACYWAWLEGHAEVLQCLWALGAATTDPPWEFQTPLLEQGRPQSHTLAVAAAVGDTITASHVLRRFPELLDRTDAKGSTALHYAAQEVSALPYVLWG